jgi:hypothetical protein
MKYQESYWTPSILACNAPAPTKGSNQHGQILGFTKGQHLTGVGQGGQLVLVGSLQQARQGLTMVLSMVLVRNPHTVTDLEVSHTNLKMVTHVSHHRIHGCS